MLSISTYMLWIDINLTVVIIMAAWSVNRIYKASIPIPKKRENVETDCYRNDHSILYFFPAFECIAQKPDLAENHYR